jgi:hypothetical protein
MGDSSDGGRWAVVRESVQGCVETYLALELDLLFILSLSALALYYASRLPTLYGAYHFANLVFPL